MSARVNGRFRDDLRTVAQVMAAIIIAAMVFVLAPTLGGAIAEAVLSR